MAETKPPSPTTPRPTTTLGATGHMIWLGRAPEFTFRVQSANLAGVNLGVAFTSNPRRDVQEPGDKVDFNPLVFRFVVDEDLDSYFELWNWVRELAPVSEADQWRALQRGEDARKSDLTLQLWNRTGDRVLLNVLYKGVFPIAVDDLDFDATLPSEQNVTASATMLFSDVEVDRGQR